MAVELPLEVVLGMVGVGVPLVVLLAHLTGGSTPHPLAEAALRARIADEAPRATVEAVQIADDGAMALARTADGRIWVAWAMESHPSVRALPRTARLTETDAGVAISLADPSWPDRTVRLADPALRDPWLAAFETKSGVHHGAA
jgi:hypothetical protein